LAKIDKLGGLRLGGVLGGILLFLLLIQGSAGANSLFASSGGVGAGVTQAWESALLQELGVQSLLIELWPEYDRPETLLIYHVALMPTVTLPVQVSFQLPGHIEKMHVVAIERDGVLVEVPSDMVEFKAEGDGRRLSFSTLATRFQFEYYDPKILTKQGQERQLSFDFGASYPAEQVTLQLQEPFETENLSLQPAPTNSFMADDGFKYYVVNAANVTAGQVVTLTATYQRATETLSAAAKGRSSPAEPAPNLSPASTGVESQNLAWGYTLIGIGGGMLLAVIGLWAWSKWKRAGAEVTGPTRRPHKRRGASVKPAEPSRPAGFCVRCGTALRDDARFCHRCGAPRRQE
jgi:hypothetical protein